MPGKTLYLYKGLWSCHECGGEAVRIPFQFIHDRKCSTVKSVTVLTEDSETESKFHYCTYGDTPQDSRVKQEGERLHDAYLPGSPAFVLGHDIILTVQRYQKARRLLDYLVNLTADGALSEHPERKNALAFLDALDREMHESS